MISERSRAKTSFHQEHEDSSVSKCLFRTVSQNSKKKNHENVMDDNDDDDTRGVSFRCLSLYNRAGGCKVGAATSDEFGEFENGSKTKDTSLDCFSYGVERFWKKNNKKKRNLEIEQPGRIKNKNENKNENTMYVFLPDDILEMCLMRLPLTSLMNARLVCKKWKTLTTSARFIQMRRDGCFPSPWLFLFGTVKDNYCSREIHAFDVSSKRWHKIESTILTGRFSFSVATIHDNIIVVGGCSSLTNSGQLDRNSFKTHKGVALFNPLTKSWYKVGSMKHARSNPVLGVHKVKVNSERLVNKSQHNRFFVFAVGGFGSWDEPLDSCEIYDSSLNKWTEIERVPIGFGPVCSGIVCNGTFYVYSETDKLAAYHIEMGFWVRVETGPGRAPPRVHGYYPKLVSCGGQRLFMVAVSWCESGGEIGRRNKAVRKLWELDLVGLTWSEVSVHPDAPMDSNAVFVGDKKLVFGVEMFKIFGQVLEFVTMCDGSDPMVKWVHVSKNQVAREMDAVSCGMKSMAVVHL